MKYLCLCLVFLFVFVGNTFSQDCTGESSCGAGNSTPCPTKIETITLCWDANTEPDLAGYKIYWGFASRDYTEGPLVINDPDSTGTYFVIDKVGDWYLAAVAFDEDDNESAYSDELWLTVTSDGLGKVFNIRWNGNFGLSN